MSRHTLWLQSEINTWVHDGVIDDKTAQTITARYPDTPEKSWGLFLLTAVGAIIFGLGVILFFAYNWADLSKFAKLALILLSLIVAHATALIIRIRQPINRNLIEGFHVIGTMMFGAGIWLIAQIYNIDEHYPNAFLIWGLGALVLAWAIPSVLQGLIASILLLVWGTSEVVDFDNVHITSVALIALGIIPLAWVQRSRVLLLVALLFSLGLLLFNIGIYMNSTIVFYLLGSLSMLLIATAYVIVLSTFPGSADVVRGAGVAVYGVCIFIMTFLSPDYFNSIVLLSQSDNMTLIAVAIQWGFLLAAVLAWSVLFFKGIRPNNSIDIPWSKSAQHFLILVSAIVLALQALGVFDSYIRLITLIYNAILAIHCVLLIIRGTDNLAWRQVTIGCITLAVLVYVRFNDLFDSLLLRSLVFLLIGAMLFLIGHLYAKRKTQRQTHGQSQRQISKKTQGQAHA